MGLALGGVGVVGLQAVGARALPPISMRAANLEKCPSVLCAVSSEHLQRSCDGTDPQDLCKAGWGWTGVCSPLSPSLCLSLSFPLAVSVSVMQQQKL